MLKGCPTSVGFVFPILLETDLIKVNIEQRRRAEASGEFTARYAIRAGIEATNSELKRGHGFGRLRVRGSPRVALSVNLKALACNIKRMICTLEPEMPQDAGLIFTNR